MQANSNPGKDQKEHDLGDKVKLGGDDPSATEFSRLGTQPCNNKGFLVHTDAITAKRNSHKREAQSILNLIHAGKAKMKKTGS